MIDNRKINLELTAGELLNLQYALRGYIEYCETLRMLQARDRSINLFHKIREAEKALRDSK